VQTPEDLRYTDQHEWIRDEGEGRYRIGITDYAQDALGDVVFVDLPAVGTGVGAGDVMSEIESTKSVSEVFAPLAGTIVEINDALVDAPELVNRDPYGEGWFVIIECDAVPEGLLDAAAYGELTA
jgi:glycine cleavage system H protein